MLPPQVPQPHVNSAFNPSLSTAAPPSQRGSHHKQSPTPPDKRLLLPKSSRASCWKLAAGPIYEGTKRGLQHFLQRSATERTPQGDRPRSAYPRRLGAPAATPLKTPKTATSGAGPPRRPGGSPAVPRRLGWGRRCHLPERRIVARGGRLSPAGAQPAASRSLPARPPPESPSRGRTGAARSGVGRRRGKPRGRPGTLPQPRPNFPGPPPS